MGKDTLEQPLKVPAETISSLEAGCFHRSAISAFKYETPYGLLFDECAPADLFGSKEEPKPPFLGIA